MEPNNNIETGAELPQPQIAGAGQYSEKISPSSPELRNSQLPTMPPASQQTINPSVNNSSAYTQQAQSPAQTANQTAITMTDAMIADDADLIEKEWVTRAKAIVAQTKDDPHSQNKEMSKVKAEYIKKRYNKDLKVSEG